MFWRFTIVMFWRFTIVMFCCEVAKAPMIAALLLVGTVTAATGTLSKRFQSIPGCVGRCSPRYWPLLGAICVLVLLS